MQLEYTKMPGGGEVSLNYIQGIIYPYVILVTGRDGKQICRISTDNQENAYRIYNRELTFGG
jgi:hypothetical protein